MTNSSQPVQELIKENALLKLKLQEFEQTKVEKSPSNRGLQQSDNNSLTLIQEIPTAVVVHGPDTQIIDSNRSAQELLGLTEEQLLGKTAIDKDWYFSNPDGSVMKIKDYPVNKVIATREPLKDYTLGIHHPHEKLGDHIWVLINANPVFLSDEIVRVIVTFVDITERKRTEEALLESERKYRNLYHYAHVGLFETSLVDGTIMACNQRYCNLAGFRGTSEAIGMDTLHLYASPSDREKIKKILGKQGYINDYELKLKNRLTNAFFWAEFSARPDPSRAIIEGTIIEITERKQAEDELRRLRNYLSNIIDSMPSMLIGVDHEGRVTQWNRKMVKTTGITADIAHGKSLYDMLPWMVSERGNIRESIRTKQVIQDPKRRRSMKDGTCYEDITIFPLITNDMEGAVIRIDDVTEKVQLEKRMIQSEKMLSVGGLEEVWLQEWPMRSTTL